jgi:hypothetical protein
MFAASKSGSAVAKDPKFNYVTMLLHGDGTNGAQNNTFLDSSTNNFTITRNGNTTQGTFTPYGSNWSNYFGGLSDYLTMPDNANYVISGDFTVEAWIFPTSFAGTNGNIVLAQWPGSTATNQSFQFFVNSTGKVGLVYGIGSTNASVNGTTLSCTLNTWNHIAVTRSGTTVRYFVNGSLDATSSTVSGAFNDSTGVMSVGRINATDSGYFSGYISNCRLVIGTALYTSAFTPSTAPLTAISGTQVLVCQSSRFLDTSSNNATITVGGSPSVQRFSPFSPTTAYDSTFIGGSSYFDGNGDWLSIGSSGGASIGTSDFTIEFWIYLTNSSVTNIDYRPASTNGPYITIGIIANSTLDYTVNGSTQISGGSLIGLNTWAHMAISRVSGNTRMFVNGVQTGSTWADSTTYNASNGNIWYNAFIGARPGSGYISGFRLVKTGLYSTTFTPPTSPPTAITNTQALLNFINAGILDNAEMNDLETVGNAQISTSVKKYGTGSMYFDGAGDYLVSDPATTQLYSYGGDFTIELWLYRNATGQTILVDSRPTGGGGSSAYYVLYVNTSNVVTWNLAGATRITGSTTISNSTWYHIAVSRSGSSTKLFVNGTQEGSTYTDSTALICATSRPYIGIDANDGTSALNGYIDDLRVTKGYARYTANFTAPTSAFPNQ